MSHHGSRRHRAAAPARLVSGAPPVTPNAIPPLVVRIPAGPPSGQVANTTTGFVVGSALGSGPARFIFAGLGRSIAAWNPAAAPADALVVATTPGASYTGLTLLTLASGAPVLLASDFARERIDVFDSSFARGAAGGCSRTAACRAASSRSTCRRWGPTCT